VVVTAFAAQASGLIQAATYGRGAYQLGVPAARPAVTLTGPDVPSVRAGTSVAVAWATSPGDAAVASHSIRLSTDGGRTFPIVVATDLPGEARSFDYVIPASVRATKTARLLVVATDVRGNQAEDSSDQDFRIKRARR
jgi:hypothetical protein